MLLQDPAKPRPRCWDNVLCFAPDVDGIMAANILGERAHRYKAYTHYHIIRQSKIQSTTSKSLIKPINMSFSDVLKSRDMNAQQPPSPSKHSNAKPANNLHRQALNSSNNSFNSKENHRYVFSPCVRTKKNTIS